jgi:UDP-glucose 4-epimerase
LTRIAVTGANGFIGKYLVERLLNDGHDVLCLGRSEQSLSGIQEKADRHLTDFSATDLSAALNGCHSLVHLAGRRSVRGEDMEFVGEFASTGLSMLDGLLRASLVNNLTQIVQISSIAVYSKFDATPFEDTGLPAPASNYGLAKLFCEQYADWWSARHGIPVAHLRVAACYGAGEKLTPALMSISDKARRKERVSVSDGGSHTIDQIYVADVVEAIRLALENNATGSFNIGSGKAVSILEIAHTANEVFDNVGKLDIGELSGIPTMHGKNFMKINRAFEKLGWRPQHSLKDGLTAMRDDWNNAGFGEN